MINFAPFYKEISLKEVNNKKLKKRVGKVDYKKNLKLLHDSFKFYNPHNNFIVQTDNITELPYPCHRSDLSHMNIMESLIVGNLNYVKDILGKSILVGADNIVLNPVDSFFDDDFDIGLFCISQRNQDEKFNLSNGVVLVNSNLQNHERIVDFFNERYLIYKNFDSQYKSWWGDMLSLNLLVSKKDIINQFYQSNKTTKFYDFDGLTIKIFEVNKDYYKWVDRDGHYNKSNEDILLDFPGDNSVKRHAELIFNSLSM